MGNKQIDNAMRWSGFSYVRMLDLLKAQVIDNATNTVKVRYGEEIYLYENESRSACTWIEKYDKKFANRPKSNNGMLTDCQFVMHLDDGTFCFVQIGNYVNSFGFTELVGRYREQAGSTFKLYIFGKHYKKYVKELRESIQIHDSSSLYIYDVKGHSDDKNEEGIDSVGRIMTKRDINTLFFNDHVKETICNHIDSFLVNKSIYESKNLTYKTGILLYGDPGTGKTSLSTALATKYNYNVIVIDMATFDKLNTSTLTTCINADTDKYIILLEDIDTLYSTLKREDEATQDVRKVINKMLQFLDSSQSPNDVIFIATTNHIDTLDDALKRDGRFDLKIEIGNIDRETAAEMVRSFQIEGEDVDKIIDECDVKEGNLYNPSQLQNKILSHFKGAVRLADAPEEEKKEEETEDINEEFAEEFDSDEE